MRSAEAPAVVAVLDGGDLALGLVIAALMIMSILLAVAETSLTRTSRSRAEAMVDADRPGSRQLAWLLSHPERFLNPVLLMISVCLLTQAALTGVLADRVFGGWALAIAVVGDIVVVFVLAQAAPRTWAIQHPERSALIAARPVAALARFAPLLWISRGLIGLANVVVPGTGLKAGPFVSEEELLALVDVAVEEDVIEEEERDLISQIIEFGDTIVREVMIPRPDMVTVAADFRVSDAMEVMIMNGMSRVPACGEGIDDVVGIVYAKDLMRAERDGNGDTRVAELMRDARFVPETKRVASLLGEMQADHVHLAIVVDEYGGTAGLVTLEDLIEELVGEIHDEYDREEPMVEQLAGGAVRVNAAMPVDEVNELVGAEMPEGDWDTIGGLMFHLLGHVPVEGESAACEGLTLVAERVQRRRIGRVRIRADGTSEPLGQGAATDAETDGATGTAGAPS